MPFILRNVRLQGVDSVMTPQNAAHKPGSDWSPIYRNHSIPGGKRDISVRGTELCRGHHYNQIQGRTLVKVN